MRFIDEVMSKLTHPARMANIEIRGVSYCTPVTLQSEFAEATIMMHKAPSRQAGPHVFNQKI
jgi:hypothetical protein